MGVLAKLIDLLLQGLEVLEGLRAAARVAQQRRGVVDGHHLNAALFKPLPVFARDLEVGLDDAHGRDAPEADDDLRAQECCLTAEIADTGLLLHAKRIPVFGRAAFDDVRNVHIVALQADDLKHIVEQVSRAADKRLALRIFVRAGAFTDE